MSKKKSTQTKDRMIHIRLDDKTHKRLKLEAVHQDTSVQNLVETLILCSFDKSRARDVK